MCGQHFVFPDPGVSKPLERRCYFFADDLLGDEVSCAQRQRVAKAVEQLKLRKEVRS